MPKKGANLGAYSVDDMMCGVSSGGARLCDQGDEMARSMMGKRQLEQHAGGS